MYGKQITEVQLLQQAERAVWFWFYGINAERVEGHSSVAPETLLTLQLEKKLL